MRARRPWDVVPLVAVLLAAPGCERGTFQLPPLEPMNAHGLELISWEEPASSPDIQSAWKDTVYDADQDVTWLADANLAGHPEVRAAMGVADVQPNGTMTYRTAVKWVKELNRQGWAGRSDWQLPTTPTHPWTDDTCAVQAGPDGNSFGPYCQRSALGRLYRSGFHRTWPDAIVPVADHRIEVRGGHFLHHLRPGMYWTQDTPTHPGAAHTYSFTNGAEAQKTTDGNYCHVLPRVRGQIGMLVLAPGQRFAVYPNGSESIAFYDTVEQVTWPLDGALVRRETNHSDLVNGLVEVRFEGNPDVFTPPRVDRDGKMTYDAADDWIEALNDRRYAGSAEWELPTIAELAALDEALGPETVSGLLLEDSTFGRPFRNLQPFFYWSCAAADGYSLAGCDEEPAGDGPGEDTAKMRWAFNMDSGFQGTDHQNKEYFVMVYHPGR